MGCTFCRGARELRIRIAFIVTAMGTGGAEAMLVKLVGALDKTLFASSVIVLGKHTALVDELESNGAHVFALGFDRPIQTVAGLARVLKALRSVDPHLIQGWMIHGNVAAALARLALGVPIIWGVRHSRL